MNLAVLKAQRSSTVTIGSNCVAASVCQRLSGLKQLELCFLSLSLSLLDSLSQNNRVSRPSHLAAPADLASPHSPCYLSALPPSRHQSHLFQMRTACHPFSTQNSSGLSIAQSELPPPGRLCAIRHGVHPSDFHLGICLTSLFPAPQPGSSLLF